MTAALSPGERVHIIAYNEEEAAHITQLLENAEIDLQVDFLLCPTDDFWVRDNGPIFVQAEDGEWVILDWGFNGWGGDTPFALDDAVPLAVAEDIGVPVIDLSAMVLEGGAIEVDGQGTLMATRSSITGEDRNPDLTESEIEAYFNTYLGIEQVIWLDGQYGGNEDITDQHIDGFVKFVGDHTLVTMNNADLAYWYVSSGDRDIIDQASNVDGTPYIRVNLPLTQNPVQTTWGQNIGFRSSYVNYYVGNSVVLVPEYDDPMDAVALEIVQGLYPERTARASTAKTCCNGVAWCIALRNSSPWVLRAFPSSVRNALGRKDTPRAPSTSWGARCRRSKRDTFTSSATKTAPARRYSFGNSPEVDFCRRLVEGCV